MATRIESNSLLLFFGLSIVLQNVVAAFFTPTPRGYTYLDHIITIGPLSMASDRLAALIIAAGVTLAIVLLGAFAFPQLPVAPLPQAEFPTIQVSANLPGASPETMASAVATPLEVRLSAVPGVTEMTSQSSLDSTKLGREVGVRSTLDLLNAQQQLYSTKRDLALARYNYMLNQLKLSAAVGDLGEKDLEAVNSRLAR